MKRKIRIALDGPAAAGKSTVAKRIAEKLGFVYIDTGAMYRTLTYKALKEKKNLENEQELSELLLNTHIELKPGENGQLVFLDGHEVTDLIRTADVTNNVSAVAKHGKVREEMVLRQQQLVKDGGIVMDGRDIGTHVIPDAEVKVFMLASVEERARRRFDEQTSKGMESDFETLKREIAERDHIDSTREVSPLKKADDAIELDTTSLSIEEVVSRVVQLVEETGNRV